MKKTLVALAVLAASGASFAQVTMTGNFEYHYEAAHRENAAGVATEASGFGIDSSEIYFNAKEDLGAGTAVNLNMAILGADRSGESGSSAASVGYGNAAYGGDATLAISTAAMGTVTVGTTRGADYLSGGLAGVGGVGLDGKNFDSRSIRDSIGYSIPVGPVKLSLKYAEPDQTSTTAVTPDGGEQTGSTGNKEQRKVSVGVAYAVGALALDAGYASYDNKLTEGKTDYLYDLAATYDFGVAKIGGGLESRKYIGGSGFTNDAGTRLDTYIGVSVPVGALTLGAEFANRNFKNMGTDGDAKATAVSANYALSKRTYLTGKYARWDNGAANNKTGAGVGGTDTQLSLVIGHSF